MLKDPFGVSFRGFLGRRVEFGHGCVRTRAFDREPAQGPGRSIWLQFPRLSASLLAGHPESVEFSRGIVGGGSSEERILDGRLFAEGSPRIDHVKPNTSLAFPRNHLIAKVDHN